jgi:hypothetical protein
MGFPRKFPFLVVCSFFLVSCAGSSANVSRDDPLYREGYEMGRKAAEEDRITLDCADPWLSRQSFQRLRSYRPKLKKAGRSDTFVSGFQYGYKEAYRENIVTMCD